MFSVGLGSGSKKMAEGAELAPQARMKRRRFGREAKLKILREIGIAKSSGLSVGALLRREGLYSSQVAVWRRQLASGGLEPGARGPGRPQKSKDTREAEKRATEILWLKEQNRQLRAIIEAQKKIAQILTTSDPSKSGL